MLIRVYNLHDVAASKKSIPLFFLPPFFFSFSIRQNGQSPNSYRILKSYEFSNVKILYDHSMRLVKCVLGLDTYIYTQKLNVRQWAKKTFQFNLMVRCQYNFSFNVNLSRGNFVMVSGIRHCVSTYRDSIAAVHI